MKRLLLWMSVLLLASLGHAQVVFPPPPGVLQQGHPLLQGLAFWAVVLPHLRGGSVWYPLVGPYPGTVLNADSSNGFQPTARPDWYGEMRLDGTDDYVAVGAQSVFDCANTTCTLQVRARLTSPGTVYFLAKRDPSGTPVGPGGWFIRTSPTQVVVRIMDVGNVRVIERTSTFATINSGAWVTVHAVLTTDTAVAAGNAITLYINGVLDAGSTLTGSNPYTPCTACSFNLAASEGGNAPLLGAIDDVRFWTRGLSASEVWAAYVQRPPELGGQVLAESLASTTVVTGPTGTFFNFSFPQ